MEWNAENYAEVCGRVTERGGRLVDVLRKLRCKKVLDIGCGTGVLTNEIAKFAQEVIGIDSSPAMIEKAKATYPGLKFFMMDACSLRCGHDFDAVFSNAVFHFIPSQDALLRGIHEVLSPKGALVFEFGAAGNIAGLLDAVAQACAKRGKPYALRFYYPTETEYGHLLEKHGFSIESIVTYDLDTSLRGGESGLRNWINQIFCIEMEWFDAREREEVLREIEAVLRSAQWDGAAWHLPNRRLQAVARLRA